MLKTSKNERKDFITSWVDEAANAFADMLDEKPKEQATPAVIVAPQRELVEVA